MKSCLNQDWFVGGLFRCFVLRCLSHLALDFLECEIFYHGSRITAFDCGFFWLRGLYIKIYNYWQRECENGALLYHIEVIFLTFLCMAAKFRMEKTSSWTRYNNNFPQSDMNNKPLIPHVQLLSLRIIRRMHQRRRHADGTCGILCPPTDFFLTSAALSVRITPRMKATNEY